MTILRRFLAEECGSTAIEYGLIIAGIAIVVGATMPQVGTGVGAIFSALSAGL